MDSQRLGSWLHKACLPQVRFGSIIQVTLVSWPKMHIRSRFVLSWLGSGRVSGCSCPVGRCDRHSAAYRMLVMALSETLADSLPRVCPVQCHSTSRLAKNSSDGSVRPGHLGAELTVALEPAGLRHPVSSLLQ